MICCQQLLRWMSPCVEHGDDCPDVLVRQFSSGMFVLPIHDGGDSGVEICYCPWCGSKLSSAAGP